MQHVCQLLKIPVLSAADMHCVSASVTQTEKVQAHHNVFAQRCPNSQLTVLCTYSTIYSKSVSAITLAQIDNKWSK